MWLSNAQEAQCRHCQRQERTLARGHVNVTSKRRQGCQQYRRSGQRRCRENQRRAGRCAGGKERVVELSQEASADSPQRLFTRASLVVLDLLQSGADLIHLEREAGQTSAQVRGRHGGREQEKTQGRVAFMR
jgi:hypothetical protein